MSRWMIGYPQLFWWSLLGKIILGMFSSRSVGIADHSCELCNFGHDWMVDPRRTFYQKPWASRSWTANRRSYDIILPHLNIIQSASVYGGRVAAGTILVLLAWLVVPPPTRSTQGLASCDSGNFPLHDERPILIAFLPHPQSPGHPGMGEVPVYTDNKWEFS